MSIRLHEIGTYALRNYVLETPAGLIAIDTGYPGGFEWFASRLQRIAPLSDLKFVFLTHAHDDHAGFLQDVLDRCDAQVVLSPLAVPVLERGENAVVEGAGYSSRIASLFGVFKKDFSFPPVQVGDRALFVRDERDQVFEQRGLPLRIVLLPGHTPCSIGLYLTDSNELLCGDAAMNAVISVAKHTIWIDDKKAFQASWDKIIGMDVERIYPAHGNPFPAKELARHRRFLDNRTLIPMEAHHG